MSKKMRAAIRDAIDRASAEVVSENAPECDAGPPELWAPGQRNVFDQAHEVAYRANKRIDALLAQTN